MNVAGPRAAGAGPGALDAGSAYRRLVLRRLAVLAGLGAVLAASLVGDLMLGPARYAARDVVATLLRPGAAPLALHVVIWDIRLPTALMALVTGAALSVAGAQMQTVLDNPLASPFTLGISAAASFGAALALVFGVALVPFAVDYVVPLNAFACAMAAALLIHAVSRLRGAATETVILLGIAMVFGFDALIDLLQVFASEQALGAVVFWTMGSLTKATWPKLAITSLALLFGLVVFVRRAWALTTLRLGDDKAASFGVDVARLRLETMLVVSLLAAIPIAFVGTIGFVGLVGPHIARMLIGEDQRFFLPASALAGAGLLSLASILSKLVIPGLTIPIGIVTALIGMPAFVALILRRQRPSW